MTEISQVRGTSVPNQDPKTQKTASGGGQTENVNLKDAKAPTSDEAFEKSGLMITKEDVKAAQNENERHIKTSDKTKRIVADMHNRYARQILAETGGNEQLQKYAGYAITQLPKFSKSKDLANFETQCKLVLAEFHRAVENNGLGQLLVRIEQNNQNRHDAAEVAADVRADQIKQTIVQTGRGVVAAVNEHTDEVGEGVKQTVKDEGTATRRQVKATGSYVIRKVNEHITTETDRAINANAQNMSAMLGVDADGYTQKDDNGDRLLYNGEKVDDKSDAVSQVKTSIEKGVKAVNDHTTREADRVNKHTSAEVKKIQLTQQQTDVLNSKRERISNKLMHEDSAEWFGFYRDSTVKWIASAADRVMADSELSFDKKKEALDELGRMVDEEIVISDGDKSEFEGKYFYDTREHRHI